MSSTIATVEAKRTAAIAGGDAKRVAAQHAEGHLTARERRDVLLDDGYAALHFATV